MNGVKTGGGDAQIKQTNQIPSRSRSFEQAKQNKTETTRLKHIKTNIMNTSSRSQLLLSACAALITAVAPIVSHADPGTWGYRFVTVMPVQAPVCVPAPTAAQPVRMSNPGAYLPHLAHAYRLGYCAGRQDRACGFDRNYRRAFEASGSSWESYFQEGYADGYECRPMNQ